jgi:hypothetical protein
MTHWLPMIVTTSRLIGGGSGRLPVGICTSGRAAGGYRLDSVTMPSQPFGGGVRLPERCRAGFAASLD